MSNDAGAAILAMLAPGAKYEIRDAQLAGIDHKVFANIPDNMAGLYREGLAFADETFLVYQQQRWTYEETLLRAARMAQYLSSELGVKKGDRVALASRNCPEWIATYMAVTMLGAVIVPMNSWWLGSELEFGLRDSGARVLVADPQRLASIADKQDELALTLVGIEDEQAQASVLPIHQLMEGWQQATIPDVLIEPEDWATMLYTSGSTGNPKGVVSTHRNVLSQVYSVNFGVTALAILSGANIDPSRKKTPSSMLLPLPLFHVTGCNVQFLPSFLVGRKLVMMYKWDAGEALKLIEQEKINAVTGVPTMGQDLIEHPDFDKYDLSSLKELSSGGAPKPPEQVRAINQKAPNLRAGVGYGLTEVNGVAASMGGPDYLRYPHACGKAIPPLTQIKVMLENGQEAKLEEWGEVWIKSPAVMQGYWNREEATKEVLTPDGWFKTGDIGYLNAEGFLFLVDRAKDLVIRGGENIGCAEVEGAIALHPGVMEVAVYGLPHARLGETVAATVMLKPDVELSQEEMQAFLQDKLSHFKIPEHVFFQYEPLPRGATEKIFKRGIREQAMQQLAC